MPAVLLFDTNIWSDLVLGSEAERQHVQRRLAELRAVHGSFAMATSRICVAEALVAARTREAQQDRERAEGRLREEFDRPGLRVVELTDKIFGTEVHVSDRAAGLRADMIRRTRRLAPHAEISEDGGKLKLPDALIAASCFCFSPPAVLFTKNARDFQVVDEKGAKAALPGLVVESLGPGGAGSES